MNNNETKLLVGTAKGLFILDRSGGDWVMTGPHFSGRSVYAAMLDRRAGRNRIWAAAIDVTAEEPLPAASPLWTMPNVFVTPHTAGETRAYEDNVIDILVENLDRRWRDEKAALRNQVL